MSKPASPCKAEWFYAIPVLVTQGRPGASDPRVTRPLGAIWPSGPAILLSHYPLSSLS